MLISSFTFAQQDSVEVQMRKRFKIGIDFFKLFSVAHSDNSAIAKLPPSSRFEIYSSIYLGRAFSFGCDVGYSFLNMYYWQNSFIEKASGIYFKPGVDLSIFEAAKVSTTYADIGMGTRLGVSITNYNSQILISEPIFQEQVVSPAHNITQVRTWFEGYFYARVFISPTSKHVFSFTFYPKLRLKNFFTSEPSSEHPIFHIAGFGQNTFLSPAFNLEVSYHFK